ncbi:MAG TPA: glutathione S-transferase [Rhodospirillaceae bacterium]|nr:glutathione S-transferase [Rhodospirillaceae bacterium]
MTEVFRLHHHPLDPPSRRVRLCLAEKEISFETILEKPWAPREEYRAFSPAGDVPTLVIETEPEHIVISDASSICEFLEETEDGPSLLGEDPVFRAEVRRLVNWFEIKMYAEASAPIIEEKAIKRFHGGGEPDSLVLRAGLHNIHGHLDYISWLTERRNWLAGDQITLADLAAAAQISCIDYLGDVPWERHAGAKEWYARIKSRPTFRPLLGDHLSGILPAKHYADLDF